MAFDQQDLDRLSFELRDFTKGMEDFISKGGFKGSSGQLAAGGDTAKSFDKGTEKIVNALGLLSVQLTKKNQTEAQREKYIAKFNKEVEKATETQKEAREQDEKIAAQKNKEQKEEAERSEWRKKSFDEQKKALEEKLAAEKKVEDAQKKAEQKKAINDLTERKRSDAMTETLLSASTAGDVFSNKLASTSTVTQLSFKALGAVVEGVTAGLSSYSSAIYKGERGTIVAAKAMTATASPLLSLVKTIGMAVAAIGAFIPGVGWAAAAMGLLAAGAAKAGELYLKLNELGAEQTDKLLKSYNALSKSGLSTAGGMDDVYKRLHDLGMSVSEVENFTKLLTSSSKDLALMGKSASEGAVKFTEVGKEIVGSDLGKSLRMMGITADEQREAAVLYMSIQAKTGQLQGKNAADLARGTGNLLKEMDALAQLTGTSVEEQKKIQEMSTAEDQFMAAMDDAAASGDEETIRRLKNYEKAAKLAASMGDQEGAKGLLQQGASPYSTDIGMKSAQTYLGGNALGGEREMSDEEILKTVRSGMNSQRDRFSGVSRHLEGGIKGTGMSTVGSAQLSKQITMLEGKSYADITKGQAAREAQGGRTEAAVMAGIQMEKAAQIQDAAVFKFNDAAQISKAASTAFANAVEIFGDIVGVDPSIFKSKTPATPAPAVGGSVSSRGGGISGGADGSGDGSAIMDAAAEGQASKPPATRISTKSASPSPVRGSSGSGTSAASSTDALAMLSFGNQSGSRENFLELEQGFQQKVLAAAAEYHELTGKKDKLRINSAKRDSSDQERLYDETVNAGRPGIGPNGMPVGKPGTSKHEKGLAVDIQQGKSGPQSAIEILNKHGLTQTVPNDPVHFAKTGGIFRGPITGYNVELHGDEAVVPMNDGVSKQALNTSVFNQDTSAINDLMVMFETMQYKYDQMIDLLGRQADNGDKLVLAAY